MFSIIKELTFGFFGYVDNVKETQEDVNEILKAINFRKEDENKNSSKNDLSVKTKIGQCPPQEYDIKIIKYTYKTGKITQINDHYGIIDNVLHFNNCQIPEGLKLKKGDEIVYTSFKVKEPETENVDKICSLKYDSWEFEDKRLKRERKNKSEIETNEIEAMTRLLTGKITQKKGRELFIEPHKIWCNLDKVQATFVPLKGDWICLDAIVSIDDNAVDLGGNILIINSIKPILIKKNGGRITYWNNEKKNGAIENKIFFSQDFCTTGYIPNIGDEVTYAAIESEQENYTWRALMLTPNEVQCNVTNFEIDSMSFMTEKNEISITPISVKVKIEFSEIKNVSFTIVNNSEVKNILSKINVKCTSEKSQIKVIKPDLSHSLTLWPQESYQIDFEIKGEVLGVSEEICEFVFEDFDIKKLIVIEVTSNSAMNRILNCEIENSYFRNSERYTKVDFNNKICLFGEKLRKPPKFKKGKKTSFYEIPKHLLNAVFKESGFKESKASIISSLEKFAPFLKNELDKANYLERFHTLLYLEEIELKIHFSKLNKKGIILCPRGEYLVIEIDTSPERKPFPVVGDKVILSQPWYTKKNICQIGYIHEILQKEILVKFHESFHQYYDKSECDIVFEPSLGNLYRAHDAVVEAVEKLGFDWLFPTKVYEKPVQVDFEIEKKSLNDEFSEKIEQSVEEENKKTSKILKKKKLVWFNQKLNKIQKMAVINVLKGCGRPLPYIIFGPPGTGKTITLVELIMQIYYLIPHSRILVATPSNSACDLLCERLIDAGQFKPGQLVRLLAYYRARSESVPLKLLPYCSLVDIADNNNYKNEKIKNIKVQSKNQFKGRQRIILGTCTCLSILRFLDFPPGHFSHILVDEGAQATEPDVLIPATFQSIESGQVVLVGDPQQLGPVCFSRFAIKYGLGVSLIQRLLTHFPYQRDFDSFSDTCGYDPRFVTKLQINYRSVPDLLSLPSKMFYNSELISSVSAREGPEADLIKNFNAMRQNENEFSPMLFHGIIGRNYQEKDSASWFNPHEVWEVVTYLKKLYDIGLTCDNVGIITPYMKQVQKLKFVLNALDMAAPKIGTVEDFQGQERMVIILTTVRSDFNMDLNKNKLDLLGFISCPRRLNVAITRARALLIILGNPKYLSVDSYWKSVIDYCRENNCFIGKISHLNLKI